MRYYKVSEEGKLLYIGTGYGGTEITEDEYKSLLAEIHEKINLEDKLYREEIAIDAVPAEWQEEIQQGVNERLEMEAAAAEEAEATDADYQAALAAFGVEVQA